MDKFIFDLQRFADYSITAGGSSATISGNGFKKTISVTTGSTTATYSVIVSNGGTAVVSADTDGTVQVNITSGYAYYFRDESDNSLTSFVLVGGTFRNIGSGQPIIFGVNGPEISNIYSGSSSNPVDITLTPRTNYNEVTITCNTSFSNFSIGGFSYAPAVNSSTNKASVTVRIGPNGRTFFDVDENDASDTIKYNDGTTTRSYTPISGTVTLAMDNDGSNAYATGLEVGDIFRLGDITCIMGATRLMITDGTTNKFWSQGTVDSTALIPLSSLNFDSEDFTTAEFLIDGTDYYTVLNPGLVPLLTDGTAATQYTGANDTTTGVAIGVGNMQVTMAVPVKLSPSNVTRILLDIAPPAVSSQALNVYMPYNSTSFYFKVTMTSGGLLTVDTYNNSTQLDTTGGINLANYGVDLTAPIRLMLQTQFARTNSGKTFVTLNVGSYTRKQQLSTNVIFDGTNCIFKFASDSTDEIKISNIIIRDEQIGQIAERIISLPVSATATEMIESNGRYTATVPDQKILQTPGVSNLVQTHDGASVVTAVLVVGNPAYKTSNGLNKLISIDKTNGIVTEHKTFELDTNATKAIADNWRPENATLNGLANMQFGWKAGA